MAASAATKLPPQTPSSIGEVSWSNMSLATTSIFLDYQGQLQTTAQAVKLSWVQLFRRLRMTWKDIEEGIGQIVEKKRSKQGKGSILDALTDKSPLSCYEADRFFLQETYFGISILMLAQTLGGIAGNLWTEFTWAPQLGVLQALLIIVLVPLHLLVGLSTLSDSPTKRRSELFAKLFFIGFSMGRLCDYTVMSATPRLLSPLVFAYLFEKFVHECPKNTSNKPQSRFKGTRLELFFMVALTVLAVSLLSLFVTFNLSFFSCFICLLCSGAHLQLLINHFQLFFYGLCTLRERWNMETMKEDEAQHFWDLDNLNPWLANTDLAYALLALLLDVMMALIHT